MAFTTQLFIFVFFPLCFGSYYLVAWLQKKGFLSGLFQKLRATDILLIGIGCVFYMWTCFDDLFRFLVYILIVYLFGKLIQRTRKSGSSLVLTQENATGANRFLPVALLVFFVAVLFVTYVLIHFNYTNLLTHVWNFFFKDTLAGKSVIAPLGISFITFSAISYLADIYMGKAGTGSLIDCALYLTFFPKVVSGPIVLWRDFGIQIKERKISLTNVSDGITRMMIGFAKKLILADTFGACIASASGAIDSPTAFGVGLLYMLQIYYDFSGYSDIAIGLSNALGFHVKENFNFPYLSCSITEFWRRWHISLGTWFREYVYFPLGGSRAGKTRTIVNIGVIFLLTGIWHGAGWTYMIWGILNGLCNIAEKLLKGKRLYEKTPKLVKWAFTMTITYFCWEIFRFESFIACKEWLLTLLGWKQFASIPYTWQYYFDVRLITLVIIAMLGATVWGLPKVQAVYHRMIQTKCGYLIHEIIIILLFILSIMFMVNSKYSPFIYFQY